MQLLRERPGWRGGAEEAAEGAEVDQVEVRTIMSTSGLRLIGYRG
jgi:hypothetical protein